MARTTRRRKPVRGFHPSTRPYLSLVRRYARELDAWILAALDRVRKAREAALAPSTGIRMDIDDDDLTPGELEAIVAAFGREILRPGAPIPPDRETLGRQNRTVARQSVRANRRALLRAGAPPRLLVARLGLRDESSLVGIGMRFGPGEEGLLRQWAEEGVGLIRAVERNLLEDLPAQLVAGAEGGTTWRSLRDLTRARLGVSESHLELIARDQTARLNGRITEHLQKKAGVAEYRWRAILDDRTRRSHREVSGNVYRWDSDGAPGVGFYGTSAHPGQAGQCRCIAEAVPSAEWAAWAREE